MYGDFQLKGNIREGDLLTVFYQVYKRSLSGNLIIQTSSCQWEVMLSKNQVLFLRSDDSKTSFGKHLLTERIIDQQTYDRVAAEVNLDSKRFGRVLTEMGLLNYEKLWQHLHLHLKQNLLDLFNLETGDYEFVSVSDFAKENITLNLEIPKLLTEASRKCLTSDFLKKKFEGISDLYLSQSELVAELHLKPYENHVFELVKRQKSLVSILSESELLEPDTLRILYLLRLFEVISTHDISKQKNDNKISSDTKISEFSSFEEAVKFYNKKFEFIFKLLSKEIGPISLSLLNKGVENILSDLPQFFQKAEITGEGRLNEEVMLKALWYHDFHENIDDLLKGLEEILYSQIYVVKKHMGIDNEQKILTWIKESE